MAGLRRPIIPLAKEAIFEAVSGSLNIPRQRLKPEFPTSPILNLSLYGRSVESIYHYPNLVRIFAK